MTLPRFFRTLHFRISALFLCLLALSYSGWKIWVNATIWSDEPVPGETHWYQHLAASELDSLGQVLIPHLNNIPEAESRLVEYGSQVADYDAEVSLLLSTGRVLATSHPDSLSKVLKWVKPALLDAMTQPDWDFSEEYPNPYDMDTFVNRIFHVTPLRRTSEPASDPGAYLVASFRPLSIAEGEIEMYERQEILRAVPVILAVVALSGLILMAWLSRRIQSLNDSVAAFREGDFSRRVRARSSDEIGMLGRNFNTMATSIEAMIERLRQSDRFHRQLIANISHDLRTPLASLRGYIETLTLKEDELSDSERSRYLGIITENMNHLENLIAHVLQLSELDSGQANFNLEDFSLEELLTEILKRFEVVATENEVTLASEVPDDLPSVHADPLQVGQALQNLVENGIKFNRPGGRVTVSLQPLGQDVQVTVHDTGEGIGAADLPHVFERFFTADKSRSRKGQSSGLGLAIAQRIIAGHQRELTVESKRGKGTSFRFTLPATASSQGPYPDQQTLRREAV